MIETIELHTQAFPNILSFSKEWNEHQFLNQN